MQEKNIKEVVEGILLKHKENNLSVIAVLQDVQEELRYLPREAFEIISKELGISMAKLYGVATFYENFSLTPKGKYIIKICDGTACHVRKSIPIIDAIKRRLDLDGDNTTTKDMLFTIETVSCLGACGLAPVLTVNDKVYPAMTPDKAVELVDMLTEKE
ncbi:MAG: NAD(P)H-dependent oxidoreductase subunit E [Anaerovoracaceae bacterium]